VKANFGAGGAAGPGTFAVLADGAEARGDLLTAVDQRARVRDETPTSVTRGRWSRH